MSTDPRIETVARVLAEIDILKEAGENSSTSEFIERFWPTYTAEAQLVLNALTQ